MIIQCGNQTLDLSTPKVMGVLNVTPDSFSDGGKFSEIESAIDQAERMIGEGAAIIDIGGESTRPGAEAVSEKEELKRVIPTIEALREKYPALVISIDSSTPKVIRESANSGVSLVNDVRSLTRSGALEAAASTQLPVCLMHMQGEPGSMQNNPDYENVVEEVYLYLARQIQRVGEAGIPLQQIIIDPGFGFGKTLEHNLQLLKRLERFKTLGVPLLAGMSRKTMVGQVLSGEDGPRPVNQRLFGSLAAAVMAAEKGAKILRVHDVQATVDAVAMVAAVQGVK